MEGLILAGYIIGVLPFNILYFVTVKDFDEIHWAGRIGIFILALLPLAFLFVAGFLSSELNDRQRKIESLEKQNEQLLFQLNL